MLIIWRIMRIYTNDMAGLKEQRNYMRRLFALLIICVASLLSVNVSAEQNLTAGQYVVGVVYNDANKNSVRDGDEAGIKGVRISNGIGSVKTDRNGKYKLPVSDDTIIFVIKPRNWMTRLDENNVPRYYYIHKPKGSPQLLIKGVDPTGPLPASVDFPLYPHREPNKFKAAFLGDTQVLKPVEITYLSHDIIEELVGTDASFCVALGDVAFNDMTLYEPLLPVMGRMGIPAYYVKGNHDTNYDAAPFQKYIDETFERTFGPPYYSFDYGPVHFIALSNPNFSRGNGYFAKLDDDQMAFLKDDLASIPRKQLVVLMMHIPITEMTDRKDIYELLKTHPNTFSMSAHTHTQDYRFIDKADGWGGLKPHLHLVNGATCGSWWSGAFDESGIPHTTMRDGAPNGYSIITFNGSNFSVRFKGARKPDNYQMNIYAPDIVEAAKAGDTEVLVNVFAGSERSRVEMRLGDKGDWILMERIRMEDPSYVSTKTREDNLKPRPGPKLPNVVKSSHIWKAKIPGETVKGTYLINVRTTDMFRQTYTASRIVSIQ